MSSTPLSETLRYKRVAGELRRYYAKPSVQTSLTVVLSIFIVAFFITAAIRPTLRTIAELNATIDESREALVKLENKSRALQQIGVTWERISPMVKFVDNSIPLDGPRYKELSKSVEVLAFESGVTLRSKRIGGALTYSNIVDPYTGKNRTVMNMPYTLSVTGGFLQVNKFLDELSAMDRLVSIDSISMTKDTKVSEEENTVNLNVTGNVHYGANEAIIKSLVLEK